MSDDNTNEETTKLTDEEAADREIQLLLLHGDAFVRLLKFERFQSLLSLNYDFSLKTDEETKIVYYEIREKSPAEVSQAMQLAAEKIKAENGPSIVTASPSELKKFS